jgi:murein DD-endopeptidase MepM/ murein hydrolase activator NlpD
VHAVADGPVVAAVDGLPEQVAGAEPMGTPLAQRPGNRIIQDIGGGNFVLYAHLEPDSITAKVGNRLQTGQIIGQLGNSGHTTGPHLHFEVMSAPDPLRANGLPFVFASFRLDSRIASEEAMTSVFQTGGPAQLQPGFAAEDKTNVMRCIWMS